MGTRRKKKVPQHIAPDKGLSGEVSKSLRTCEYPWPGSLGRKNPLDFSPILASFFFLSAKADKTGVTGFLSSCRFVFCSVFNKNRTRQIDIEEDNTRYKNPTNKKTTDLRLWKFLLLYPPYYQFPIKILNNKF